MKAFRKLCIAVLGVFLLVAAAAELTLLRLTGDAEGLYRVEAKRLADAIQETGAYDLADYPHLTGVYTEADGDLYVSDEPYVILRVEDTLYRVEYDAGTGGHPVLVVSIVLGVLLVLLIGMLAYLRRQIIVPFGRLNEVPQELAKGNLAVPIPEERSRFFGRFTWGINLLRESIEDSRRKELSMQRDKKLLLLSLSHDIKTPLSAIKLNAKALARGLYADEEKRREAAESIHARAGEIEDFVSQITQAASEDFMQFEVTPGEAFLSQILAKIEARYAPQLAMAGTELVIPSYDDCLLSCDPDRLAECLQNLMENAIKYGDGRRIGLLIERMDGCVLITVKNTGCRLPESELPEIFESFHRGSNTGNAPGNGLGLFICRRLMSLMGGEVYAELHDGCFCATLVVRMV